MFPFLPSRRVTDKDCIVELLLRAGANPNILTEDRGDNCHWIWSNIFKHYNYPHPLVLALILADADVGCSVPIYHQEECHIQGNASLFDYAMFVCKGRLNSFKKGRGSIVFSCRRSKCSFQILRSSIRCLYLLVAAGANVSSDHIDALKGIRDELHAIAATGKLSQTESSTRLFHAPTGTTFSGCFMLHRTVHALWNLYGNPYRNRAETEEQTIP